MTVKELKQAIESLPDDMEVICQRDPEGNGYSPCAGVDPDAIYVDEDNTVYSTNWSADECCLEEEEWEKIKDGPKSLIVYPKY